MLAAALSACALSTAGCGGGADSNGVADAGTTQARATVTRSDSAPPKPTALPKSIGKEPSAKGPAPGAARGKSAVPDSSAHAAVARPQGTSSSDPAARSKSKQKGGGNEGSKPSHSHAGAKHPHAGAKPGKLPQPSPSSGTGLPPGVSVYDAARQACGDPNVLEALPPERRDDAEFIIGLAAGFAPPGQEQQARDGCQAGLESLGIA